MKQVFLAMLICLTISGCANVQTSETFPAISKTSIEPEQANEEALAYADSELRAAMKDPDAVRLKLLPGAYGTRDCYTRGRLEYKVWASAVRVNVKGFYGGYTGFKTYIIYFADGKPAAFDRIEGKLQKYGTYLCPDDLLRKIR